MVTDSVESIKEAVVAAINERKDTHAVKAQNSPLSFFIDSLDLSKPMTIAEYNEAIAGNIKQHQLNYQLFQKATNQQLQSVGYEWFEALIDMKKILLHLLVQFTMVNQINLQKMQLLHQSFLIQKIQCTVSVMVKLDWLKASRMGQILNHVYEEDKDKVIKRPIVIVIDVPSQAYGYNEELIRDPCRSCKTALLHMQNYVKLVIQLSV